MTAMRTLRSRASGLFSNSAMYRKHCVVQAPGPSARPADHVASDPVQGLHIRAQQDGALSSADQRKVFCEFMAQACFNFLSCSAVAAAAANGGGSAVLSTLMVMAAHVVIIPLLIYTFGPVSGAHFNPVVTAAFIATKAMAARTGLAYIVAQCMGGILGTAAAFSSLPGPMQNLASSGIQAVPADHTVLQAFMGEVYASFLFVFVVFGCMKDKRGVGKLGPFAISAVVALNIWLVGPISSMCINPARALGPAVVTGFWQHHWIWWTAPFLGGVTAGLTYDKMFAQTNA